MTVARNDSSIEAKCVNTIRTLALDAVRKANSGHSGTAMSLAPLAHVLYSRILRHDPKNPQWQNRDRLILSAGHASMLLYGTLHLNGYDISLEDIKNFRQWGSKTPGHPEVKHTDGVEVTTGPLGQGFANAVGMAFAEEHLRATFGSENYDHNIFVICGDGDLMEGVSYEAASLAGHNKLSKLIAIYDDNKVTIDGSTDLSFSEDVAGRFRSQGWNVIEAGAISEDLDALEATINQAKSQSEAPTLIILSTQIAFPSPAFAGKPAAHGAILDDEDIAATKEILGAPAEAFSVDDEVYEFYSSKLKGRNLNGDKQDHKIDSSWIDKSIDSSLENYFVNDDGSSAAPATGDSIATRVSCGQILSTIARNYPALIGGSADLTGNTGTKLSAGIAFNTQQRNGNQIYFGIREHTMGSNAVGIALGYDLIPFVGTFFVFSDYMRPSIRLASIAKAPVLFVFSHDSVGVGEDGPTHQPIEHLAALRAIPGLNVVRPADAFETAAAIEDHVRKADGPTALILTRQNVPVLEGSKNTARNAIENGATEIGNVSDPQVVLVATGSEVHICVEAAEKLGAENIKAKVVSMPNVGKYLNASSDIQKSLIPEGIPVVSVEAATTYGWSSIAQHSIGIDRFGASAPGSEAMSKLGISVEAIIEKVKEVI